MLRDLCRELDISENNLSYYLSQCRAPREYNSTKRRMRIPDPVEVQRLTHLLDGSAKARATAAKELNDEQASSAASRKDYFEKLAFGSGAAIAAIVSFVGTHSGRLQPPWLLRCSLVSLVAALIAALFRNFRYPYYLLTVRKRLWMESCLTYQQCQKDYFRANPNTVDLHTGERIDGVQWAQDAEESDEKLKSAIVVVRKDETRFLREWHVAEYAVCFR